MTKKFLIPLFILFLLQSCSWITDFYVLNSSKSPIVITFKQPKSPETTPYLEKLKAKSLELYQKMKPTPCPLEKDIKNGKYSEICDEDFKNCRTLNPTEYKFDREECSLELTLESNQAVKLFSICCSYTGVIDEKEDIKNISQSAEGDTISLTIKSFASTTQYKGIELMRAFEKQKKTRYVLKYKEE
ncbi:hypothetical protein [Thermodesulfovibrio yellowstonii]|uniref:hypothetical protein n=1 Tax=Thermodesulfovibrio yellowstonii TaxID=28262 RepID=UPI0006870672|nr:hypothetical protein [Thermodesulfovibrio islandicus]